MKTKLIRYFNVQKYTYFIQFFFLNFFEFTKLYCIQFSQHQKKNNRIVLLHVNNYNKWSCFYNCAKTREIVCCLDTALWFFPYKNKM